MSDISNRIDNLLTQMNMKRIDLSRETGIPVSTIKNWINEERMPSVEAAYKVAQFFHVTVEWLVTGHNSNQSKQDIILSDQEIQMIELFRHLDERDQNAVFRMVESLESQYASPIKEQSISG